MREAAIVDIEIGIQNRFALRPKKCRLRLEPLAHLLLFRVSLEARFKVMNDLGVFARDIGCLARIASQIEKFRLARQ